MYIKLVQFKNNFTLLLNGNDINISYLKTLKKLKQTIIIILRCVL